MSNIQSFSACEVHNSISVTSTAGSTTFSAPGINVSQCELCNDGTNDVYYIFSNSVANGGTGVVTCTTANGAKILAGSDKIVNKGYNDTISYVCAATQTATLSISLGEGQ
jgi:hypothetical protein